MINANSFYVAASVAVERNLSEEAPHILQAFSLVASSIAVWAQELTPQERAELKTLAREMSNDADDIINENEKRQKTDGPETAA